MNLDNYILRSERKSKIHLVICIGTDTSENLILHKESEN